MSNDIPVLLDLNGLAEWLSISIRTARDLSKNWPCYALGQKTKRYDPTEVIAFLKEQRAHAEQHAGDIAGLHPRKLKVAS